MDNAENGDDSIERGGSTDPYTFTLTFTFTLSASSIVVTVAATDGIDVIDVIDDVERDFTLSVSATVVSVGISGIVVVSSVICSFWG